MGRWWRQPKWQAFLAVAISYVTIVMSSTLVFVLLPSIAEEFGVTLGAVGWVVIVESLVISALLLPLGGLADRVGRRRVYVRGLAVFGVGTVLTGLAPGFTTLIAARILMSFGNALVQSVGTGMMAAAFPDDEKGLAMGAQTTAVAMGAASGPLIGGFALQLVGWQSLFLIIAIPTAISIVAALAFLEDDRPDSQRRLGPSDKLGGPLSAGAVVALVLTISNPFGLPWLSLPQAAGAALVVLLSWRFVVHELGHPQPMLQLRLFAITAFRSAVLVRVLAFTGATTTTLLLPIYLVSLRGLADGVAGAIIFCAAVGMAIGAQISGRASDRVGPAAPSLAGLVVQTAVALALGLAGRDTPLWFLVPVVLFSGFGLTLWNVPANGTMMATAPAGNLATIGALTNVTRTMGNVLGQALTAAIVVSVMAGQGFDVPLEEVADNAGAGAAFLDGWRIAYLVTAGLTVATLAVAARLPFSPVVAAPQPTPSD